MKLHYFKILLFFLPLNILVKSSSYVHNNNKPSITPLHTTRCTSRVLSECNIQSLKYDNDPQMEKVMNTFSRKTTQRLREYDERMKEKLQKRKEERDKNIEEIIKKDKMDKLLAEKIEKGCLKCGCALGGGVLPVWGLVSGLWYATLSQYVSTTLVKMAKDAGIKAGLKVGLAEVMKIADPSSSGQGGTIPAMDVLETLTTGISGDNVTLHGIFQCINSNINILGKTNEHPIFFATVKSMAGKSLSGFNESYRTQAQAVTTAFNEAQTGILTKGGNATSTLTTGITASIVAIVVIVLIIVIIYLVLRYRRKKKMKKKAEYTKLLNQ
ncbi:rifin [Plasmodium reichenowi]|uniref:Rifin n=1 Tax=Plasmodium reichenowi TaxID=5854 RepID=A0A060RM19_PLARE|nr:rifin [Plasmodium reichenowi]